MSAASKILFSGDPHGANISGLIEALKKTSPASMSRLKEGGGRVHGENVTGTDFYGKDVKADASSYKKEC